MKRRGGRRPAAGARARQETSAGGVVYRMADDGAGAQRPLFLLIRDSYQNWGFPKGHLERGEMPEAAAMREVAEETGLGGLQLRAPIDTIEWYFRFRGRLIHKLCYFYLMETTEAETSPQAAEGITACHWSPYEEADVMISYANARDVLRRAQGILTAARAERTERTERAEGAEGAARVGSAPEPDGRS